MVDFVAALPFKVIDVVTMVIIGQTTGRRKFELLTIASSDMQLKIIRNGDGAVVLRELRLTYCWKKNLGVGKYQQLIVGNSKLENDAITFILLKAQHQGMIKSALDVYQGAERLDIDASLYESSDLLQRKLRDASKDLNQKQREQFDHGLNEPSTTLMSALIDKECVNDPSYRIPFWVASDSTLCSVTSKRMTESSSNEYISRMICKTGRNKNHHGYVSSAKKKIGITSTRKSFRTNTSGVVSANANFDLQNHLAKHCSHTEAVGKSHYENEMEYQNMIPANVQQLGDQGTADTVMMRIEHPPLYEQDGYHVEGHRFYTDALPDPKVFLKQQSATATPNGLGEIKCPVVACNHKKAYRFYADFAEQHLRKCHYVTKDATKQKSLNQKETVKCPACQQRLSLEWFFRAHILDNGNTGTCMDINSNPFARKPVATKAAAQKAVVQKAVNQAKSAPSRSVKKKKSKSDPVEQEPKAKRQNCQPSPAPAEVPAVTNAEDATAAELPGPPNEWNPGNNHPPRHQRQPHQPPQHGNNLFGRGGYCGPSHPSRDFPGDGVDFNRNCGPPSDPAPVHVGSAYAARRGPPSDPAPVHVGSAYAARWEKGKRRDPQWCVLLCD
jgi:hypothetical protein